MTRVLPSNAGLLLLIKWSIAKILFWEAKFGLNQVVLQTWNSVIASECHPESTENHKIAWIGRDPQGTSKSSCSLIIWKLFRRIVLYFIEDLLRAPARCESVNQFTALQRFCTMQIFKKQILLICFGKTLPEVSSWEMLNHFYFADTVINLYIRHQKLPKKGAKETSGILPAEEPIHQRFVFSVNFLLLIVEKSMI